MYQLTERSPLTLAYLNQRIKTTTAINIHLTISPADDFPESVLGISRSFFKEVEIKLHVMRSWQVCMHTGVFSFWKVCTGCLCPGAGRKAAGAL